MVFERAKRIRFSHCDPAGIVFYPRYVELLNEVVEDWFAEALKVDFRSLTEKHRLGIPVVRLETEFLAPARYGETLTFRLAIASIGTSSLQVAIDAHREETPCMRARLTLVQTSMETFRPIPIDDGWRAKYAAFMRQSQ